MKIAGRKIEILQGFLSGEKATALHFGVESVELEGGGALTDTMLYIELDNGEVTSVTPDHVKFLDKNLT